MTTTPHSQLTTRHIELLPLYGICQVRYSRSARRLRTDIGHLPRLCRSRSWRNRPVPDLEVVLLMVTCVGLLMGAWGILWTRASCTKDRILVGRWLFVGTLFVLGGS